MSPNNVLMLHLLRAHFYCTCAKQWGVALAIAHTYDIDYPTPGEDMPFLH